MKIGVLYPASVAHPGMSIDFVSGLQAFLKQAGIENKIELFIESIGFGGSEKEVYQQSEKLILISGIDVLIAFIDLRVLTILEPLIYATGKLILIVNPGANYPQNWVLQPNVIYLTLHHAFLCWLSGSLGMANKQPKAVMATSLYDCGYTHTACMVKGFVKSGGSISFNYINKETYKDNFQLDELISFLATDKKTDKILCVFDEMPASNFYNRLNTFNEAVRLQLFVSPMMLSDNALKGLTDKFKGSIEGYTSWLASLNNRASRIFMDCYIQQTRRHADIFALLGWEAGLIVQEILQVGTGNYTEGEEMVNQLLKTKIESPRGELKFDQDTHYVLAPVIKCTLNKNNNLEIEHVREIDKEWLSFVSEPFEGISSGWTNTYLCY